jgi:hypothetical protein
MICPEQARDPAPKEKCWMPVAIFSETGEIEPLESSQRSGLKDAAVGPK